MSAVITIAVSLLGEALKYMAEHPEYAKNLIGIAREGLGSADKAVKGLDSMALQQRLTAIASGIGASRANAVQEFLRQRPQLKE